MDARILLAAAGLALLPQKDELELRGAGVPDGGRAELRLEGRAAGLPEGARLNLALLMRIEARVPDGRLEARSIDCDSRILEVGRHRKVAYANPACRPGPYRAVVRMLEENQKPRTAQVLKQAGTAMPREWTFEFAAWGDGLAGRLGPGLQEIDDLAGEARSLVEEFKKASAHRDRWGQRYRDLDREAGKLLEKVPKSEAVILYTAAAGEIVTALDAVRSNARDIKFKDDGTFDGFGGYHLRPGESPKFQGKDYGWDLVLEHLGKIPGLAGREFALWAVKDIRRAGRVGDALAKAVQERAGHPGAAPFADPLLKGEGLDELEKAIRGEPR